MEMGAIFSDCRRWRYVLWRIWDTRLPAMCVIGTNPSVATEVINDRTISKLIKLAKLWGFGALFMLNAYAWCSTWPHEMKKQGVEAIGALNDYWIEATVRREDVSMTIAAWGIHDFLNRGDLIKEIVPNLYHLGLNKDGSPKHPLFLPSTVRPTLFA